MAAAGKWSSKDRLLMYEKDGRNTSSSDPEMMESRIFIGNLSNMVTRQQIEESFTKYGKVLGVSLHKSYGFVQFESKEAAKNAVNAENGNKLNGHKMDICIATERRKDNYDSGFKDKRGGGPPPPPRRRRHRSRSPLFPRRRSSWDRDFLYRLSPPPRIRGPPLMDPYRDPFGSRDPYLYPHDDPYDRYPPPRDDYYPHPLPHPPRLEREFRSPPPFITDYPPLSRRERYERDFHHERERDSLLSAPPPFSRREDRDIFKSPSLPSSDRGGPEVQIIIVNALQKEYAQRVRERVEGLGLTVESLHLSPTVSLAEALDNAARRGLLYTIIITNQHEAHRSVTLTILHGRNPQEHKNMPLDDAIALVDRDYDRYCQTSRGGSSNRMSGLMAKAAAGRDLSSSELDVLITNLQQKQQQNRRGIGSLRAVDTRESTLSSSVSNEDIQQQQADLQAKILSLLGSNAVVNSPSSSKVSSSSGSSPYAGGAGKDPYGSRGGSFHSVKGFGGYR